MNYVLIVDDEPLARYVLSSAIKKSDAPVDQIFEAENVAQAVELCQEHTIGLIFMDVKMRNEDGISGAKRILEVYPEIKIYIVTAFDRFDYAMNALNAGVKGFLLKPVNSNEISNIIKKTFANADEPMDVAGETSEGLEAAEPYPSKLEEQLLWQIRCLKYDEARETGRAMLNYFYSMRSGVYVMREYIGEFFMVLESENPDKGNRAQHMREFMRIMSLGDTEEIKRTSDARFESVMQDYLSGAGNAAGPKSYVEDAVALVHAEFPNCLDLETVAERLHITPSYLSTLFKRNMKIGFNQYSTRTRMQEAVRLLTTTDLTTKEICARVGYRDINHFYKVFRREQGTTPTAVRKKRK